jgi:hypothetical protein
MAQEPGFAFSFGVVLAMAVVILAITTWAAPLDPESDSVAPIPPRETIYRPEHWRVYSANSPRPPQDRLRGLGCCLGGRLFPAALLLR